MKYEANIKTTTEDVAETERQRETERGRETQDGVRALSVSLSVCSSFALGIRGTTTEIEMLTSTGHGRAWRFCIVLRALRCGAARRGLPAPSFVIINPLGFKRIQRHAETSID